MAFDPANLPAEPTVDDVRSYLGAQAGGPISEDQLDDSLRTAKIRVLERCIDQPIPLAENVSRAIVMQAARLYRRRFSVGGFEGFGDAGLARVPALDPDIEELLIRQLRYDFA
jgi:hypothetical protein